ncbi:MAG: hypothetical protein K2I20_06360 [Clostridia bacterium]|nr:hypothetical protein [Clostridia bacterium]
MNNPQKNCKNCRYYLEHYYKSGTSFKPLLEGHCAQRLMSLKEKRGFPFPEGCENWQPAAVKQAEQNERIQKTIRDMSRSLSQILQILKSE